MDRLELLVDDDGIGLSGGATRRSGLVNLTRRANQHRGRCRVYSPADGGTRVSWAVPLRDTRIPAQAVAMEVLS